MWRKSYIFHLKDRILWTEIIFGYQKRIDCDSWLNSHTHSERERDSWLLIQAGHPSANGCNIKILWINFSYFLLAWAWALSIAIKHSVDQPCCDKEKKLEYRRAYILSFRYSMMKFKRKFSVSAWLISVDDFSFSICFSLDFFLRLFAFLFIWFLSVIMCALYLYSSTFSIKVNRQMSRHTAAAAASEWNVEVLSATRVAHKRIQK